MPSIDLRKINLRELYKNKYVLLGILFFTTTIMFGYILIVPSSMKRTNQTSFSYNQSNPQSSSYTLSQLSIIPSSNLSPIASASGGLITPTVFLTYPPTPTAIPTLNPTPTLSPFAGWKTYQNLQYGYRIMYPPTWKLQDNGSLEPKIPSYIIFNQNTASAGARSITISGSTRTYEEQVAIDGPGTPVNVANSYAIRQSFRDSNGQQSTAIVIPRVNYLIILRSKSAYITTFNQMLTTLQLLK